MVLHTLPNNSTLAEQRRLADYLCGPTHPTRPTLKLVAVGRFGEGFSSCCSFEKKETIFQEAQPLSSNFFD